MIMLAYGETLHSIGYAIVESMPTSCYHAQEPENAVYSTWLPAGYVGTTQMYKLASLIAPEGDK